MTTQKKLESSWLLRKLDPEELVDGKITSKAASSVDHSLLWYPSESPRSVHEILYANGVFGESVLQGNCEEVTWIAESDWLYCTEWDQETVPNLYLLCEQVDTFADFYLNGTFLGSTKDSFIPLTLELSDQLSSHNLLVVHFKSPYRMLKELWEAAPESVQWDGHVDPAHLVRKGSSTFGSFLGAHPCLNTIGFASDVLVETRETSSIEYLDLRTLLDYRLDGGRVFFHADIRGCSWTSLKVTLQAPCGSEVGICTLSKDAGVDGDIKVSNPALWWPIGYGDQNLYTVTLELFDGDTLLDCTSKRIGFRRIDWEGDFNLRVNRVPVRLWGANAVNNDPLTQRWNAERGAAILKLVKDGNMNTLRVWGEAPMIEDSFYEFCDENGFLVWQDFPIGYGMWPDNDDYVSQYRAEATVMVKRLKHRPCLLMWCGSNENYMYSVSPSGQNQVFGHRINFEAVHDVCHQLDPDTRYYFSSPNGGAYPQSPEHGDIHGYSRIQFEPGVPYPALHSEYCHLTPLARHSMNRFMTEEELFPEGYINYSPYRADFKSMEAVTGDILARNFWRDIPVPETWRKHMSVFTPADLDHIENYYDATDADSLLYRFSACACDSFKENIENIRRGRPSHDAVNYQHSKGLLVWKLNDCFPHMNFTLVDAYLEPTPTYYAAKRGFTPVLPMISRENEHLYLWAANETAEDVTGTIVVRIFSRIFNRIEKEIPFPCRIRASSSELIANLDFLGPIHLDCLVHAQLLDEQGNVISSNLIPLDIERNMPFPDAKITMEQDGDTLIIQSDYYARYVVLSGNDEGDEFGWEFEDNYFDLLPFETKRIRILGRHHQGTVTAKAQYSTQCTKLALK